MSDLWHNDSSGWFALCAHYLRIGLQRGVNLTALIIYKFTGDSHFDLRQCCLYFAQICEILRVSLLVTHIPDVVSYFARVIDVYFSGYLLFLFWKLVFLIYFYFFGYHFSILSEPCILPKLITCINMLLLFSLILFIVIIDNSLAPIQVILFLTAFLLLTLFFSIALLPFLLIWAFLHYALSVRWGRAFWFFHWTLCSIGRLNHLQSLSLRRSLVWFESLVVHQVWIWLCLFIW